MRARRRDASDGTTSSSGSRYSSYSDYGSGSSSGSTDSRDASPAKRKGRRRSSARGRAGGATGKEKGKEKEKEKRRRSRKRGGASEPNGAKRGRKRGADGKSKRRRAASGASRSSGDADSTAEPAKTRGADKKRRHSSPKTATGKKERAAKEKSAKTKADKDRGGGKEKSAKTKSYKAAKEKSRAASVKKSKKTGKEKEEKSAKKKADKDKLEKEEKHGSREKLPKGRADREEEELGAWEAVVAEAAAVAKAALAAKVLDDDDPLGVADAKAAPLPESPPPPPPEERVAANAVAPNAVGVAAVVDGAAVTGSSNEAAAAFVAAAATAASASMSAAAAAAAAEAAAELTGDAAEPKPLEGGATANGGDSARRKRRSGWDERPPDNFPPQPPPPQSPSSALQAQQLQQQGNVLMGREPATSVRIEQKFVGFVIGPGGEALRQVREACGVAIQIEQSTREAGFSVAHIYGPQEAADQAVRLIETRLAEIDPSKEVPGGGVDEMRVDQWVVGYILGKGGETLRALKNESGASFAIDQSSKDQGFSIMRIMGTPQARLLGKQLVMTKISEVKPPEARTQGAFEFQIQQGYIGWLIGKGGETVKAIKDQSGATVIIDQATKDMGFSIVRVLPGPGAALAARLIEARIRDVEMTDKATLTEGEEFPIEQQWVGLLIGRGGETARQIKDMSGATMVINQDTKGQGYSMVRLGGPPSSVAKAREIINRKLAESQALPPLRAGPTPVPAMPTGPCMLAPPPGMAAPGPAATSPSAPVPSLVVPQAGNPALVTGFLSRPLSTKALDPSDSYDPFADTSPPAPARPLIPPPPPPPAAAALRGSTPVGVPLGPTGVPVGQAASLAAAAAAAASQTSASQAYDPFVEATLL